MSDDILNFSFDDTPDINLPPTAGIREFRFDQVGEVKMQKDARKKDDIEYPHLIVVASVNDGGKGTYPAEEQNRQVFLRYNLQEPRDATNAKRLFLASGIDTQGKSTGQLIQEIKGHTARADFRHKNDEKDGLPVVYGNVRDWIVDASMLKNVPGKTPPVPVVS